MLSLLLKVIVVFYKYKSRVEIYDIWKKNKSIQKKYPVFLSFEDMIKRKGCRYY